MKKKYLTFTVRASYQPTDDTIHLTAEDRFLASNGWHMTLNKRTETEELLRAALIEQGILDPDYRSIPQLATYPVDEKHEWYEFPLGVTRAEQPVSWDVRQTPHMLLAGPTGSGKSVIQRSLILHAAQSPDWRVVGIDLKRVELSVYKSSPLLKNRIRVAVDLENAADAVRSVEAEMMRRYSAMEALGKNYFRDLPGIGNKPVPAVLLMVDEAYVVLAPDGAKTDEGRQRDLLHGEITTLLGSIARLGRAAGVHLVVATQRPDVAVIPGELRSNLEMRVAAGRLNPTSSAMILDSQAGIDLPKIKGRGIVFNMGEMQETQFYFTPMDAFQAVPAGEQFYM